MSNETNRSATSNLKPNLKLNTVYISAVTHAKENP